MTDRLIRKAVFPVAGFGSRFLPATKAIPKEMLPIVDKPLIQYAVEEAIESGITDIVFVTGRNKRAIEDHFDMAFELEYGLEQKNELKLLEIVRNIRLDHVNYVYIRQPQALGLGHAVLCAQSIIGDEPFMVILPDDLVENPQVGCMKQMVDVYGEFGGNVIAVEEVPVEEVSSYGVVSIGDDAHNPPRIEHIIEKPSINEAPSNLAVIGRYILQPEIFGMLKGVRPSAGGEIQLTDGIEQLAQRQPVYAYGFEGVRYDCGSKLGFLKATVQHALTHDELGGEFAAYLTSLKPEIKTRE